MKYEKSVYRLMDAFICLQVREKNNKNITYFITKTLNLFAKIKYGAVELRKERHFAILIEKGLYICDKGMVI